MDDLHILRLVLDDAVESEIVKIIYKDGRTGLYTRMLGKVVGEEPEISQPNTLPAFNVNTQEWEIVDLAAIDIAESATI